MRARGQAGAETAHKKRNLSGEETIRIVSLAELPSVNNGKFIRKRHYAFPRFVVSIIDFDGSSSYPKYRIGEMTFMDIRVPSFAYICISANRLLARKRERICLSILDKRCV